MTKPLHENFDAVVARMDAAAIPDQDWNALSERFQGTIGRTFWYDVSRVEPAEEREDLMLVTVYADKSGDHIHVECDQGTIHETLSTPAVPCVTRFESHSAYMTYQDWKALMCDLMDAAWSEAI